MSPSHTHTHTHTSVLLTTEVGRKEIGGREERRGKRRGKGRWALEGGKVGKKVGERERRGGGERRRGAKVEAMESELRRVPGATLEHTRKGGRRGGEKGEGEAWRKGVGAGKEKQRGEEEGAGRSRDRTVRQKALRTCPSETRKSGETPGRGGRPGKDADSCRRKLPLAPAPLRESVQLSRARRVGDPDPSARDSAAPPRGPAAPRCAGLSRGPVDPRAGAACVLVGLLPKSPRPRHPTAPDWVPPSLTEPHRASPTLTELARCGCVPDQDGDRRGPESEHRLLLPQVELVPDRDPDNDGTKISVSITATGDRGRAPLSAARQAQAENWGI